ncbi:MAG: hypothetical protein AB9903_30215 [Vulcanimicrobiota bacterium]
MATAEMTVRERIADCLIALDLEIELLEQEKTQRQTQKKVLMELLLTGKVQVNVSDKEKNGGKYHIICRYLGLFQRFVV